jgi:hypothetical protein
MNDAIKVQILITYVDRQMQPNQICDLDEIIKTRGSLQPSLGGQANSIPLPLPLRSILACF